jgi:hypothetical protein
MRVTKILWGRPSACGGPLGRLAVKPERRRLPHFHVIGQPLFVTFPLYGSLPANRPFPASNLTSGEAFVTLDRLLDQARRGPTFLRQPDIAQLVLASIEHAPHWNTTRGTPL